MINFHAISLLCPVFIAFVFIVQLIGKTKDNFEFSKRVLLSFMATVFILSIAITINQSGNYLFFRFCDGIYMSGMLLLHPLFYLYIKALIVDKFTKQYLIHFLPSTFIFVVTSTFYLLLSKDEAIDYLSIYRLGEPSVSFFISSLYKTFILSKFIHAAQAIIYFILVYIQLSRHQKEVDNVFSSSDRYKLSWLFSFNFIYSVMSLAGVITNLMPTKIVYSTHVFVDVTMIIFGVFTLYIGIRGLEQESVGKIISLNDETALKDNAKTISDNKLIKKIDQYIIHEKAYLNPDLKIWDIVNYTGVNRSYISQAINSEYMISFSHYINKLRIEEACALLKKDSEKSIENIAFDSGFNSLSTFNRAFKKYTGTLPSEYRNKM